jgi:hypothetical protein
MIKTVTDVFQVIFSGSNISTHIDIAIAVRRFDRDVEYGVIV